MKLFVKKEIVEIKTSSKGDFIEFGPDTNGPNVRFIRVGLKIALPEKAEGPYLVVDQVKTLKFQKEGSKFPFFVIVGGGDPADKRAIIIDEFSRFAHRVDTRIDKTFTTAKVVDVTCGYGAWGSGTAFMAILEPGQRLVSDDSTATVLSWDGEIIKKERIPRDLLIANDEVGEEL